MSRPSPTDAASTHDPVPARTPLGERSPTPEAYDPSLLVGLPRSEGRELLGFEGALPFTGDDLWHAWELSWLSDRGMPVVATGRLRIPADSPRLVESKSLKLYLLSLHGKRFATLRDAAALLQVDLSAATGAEIGVELEQIDDGGGESLAPPAVARAPGICIDDQELVDPTFTYAPEALDDAVDARASAEETLHSNLFLSNCPVTGQPDWATIIVRYAGKRWNRAALLAYLVSFRQHRGFHEHCVERIFRDLWVRTRPERLSVEARFTRRGGLDINPLRSSFEERGGEIQRLWRQ